MPRIRAGQILLRVNKKAVKCPDCGKWVTLQGWGGHRRFYRGQYQKDFRYRLFNRLVALIKAGKISQENILAFARPLDGTQTPQHLETHVALF